MKRLSMKEHQGRGKLITFCGLDGCGKSTMIRMLAEKYQSEGQSVFLTKQPTDAMRKTEIFRTYMDQAEHGHYEYRTLSLMAAADRIQHCNQVIIPALREGKLVISDRYFYSCLANLRARGYQNDSWIYEIARDIPRPDYSFFLDVSVQQAVERVRSRPEEKERYIDLQLQYKLKDEYRKICDENNGILISSLEEPEKTFSKVCEYLN